MFHHGFLWYLMTIEFLLRALIDTLRADSLRIMLDMCISELTSVGEMARWMFGELHFDFRQGQR
jgi:hypothetical protein